MTGSRPTVRLARLSATLEFSADRFPRWSQRWHAITQRGWGSAAVGVVRLRRLLSLVAVAAAVAVCASGSAFWRVPFVPVSTGGSCSSRHESRC